MKWPPEFAYAKLGRAGLANLLFTWGHAEVFSYDNPDVRLLPPIWTKPRLGPYLRRERDKRAYHRLFRRVSVRMIMLRTLILIVGKRMPAAAYPYAGGAFHWRPVIWQFEGMGEFFEPLLGREEFLADRLVVLARGPLRRVCVDGAYIAVHVRLGDFVPATSAAPAAVGTNVPIVAHNISTDISWFVRRVGEFPDRWVVLCSDGTAEQLEPLEQLPNVLRTRDFTALEDLFVLANADVIIGSGSTFSAWASYLGATPIVFSPGMNHFLRASALATERG